MNRLVNIWAGNRQHILKYPQGRHHHHATWRGWNQEKRGRNKVTLVCRAKVEGGGGAGVGITEPRAMVPPTTGRPTTGKFERPPRIAQVLSTPAKAKGENSEEGEYAEVFGWVRSSRAQKSVAFVDVSDGSCSAGLQVVASASNAPDAHALVAGGECTTGCSVRVRGRLVESRAKGQRRELQCEEIEVLGACPADEYPLQKKKHSLEFLRSIAHLRPRTRTIQSAARVRSTLTQQTHAFFAKNGFSYVNTPVITRSDCEGAGEAFRVTTMAPEGSGVGGEEELERAKDAVAAQGLVVKEAKARAKERGESPNEFAKEEISRLLELKRECEALEQASAGQEGNEDDFFGGPAFLTVSGQLEAETYACALRDVYTFGPTFRAENSNTNRHLAEFWMLEPELAFAGLDDVIACAEAYIKHCLVSVLEERAEDLDFLHSSSSASTAEGSEPRTEMLRRFSTCVWHRITYTEAVDLLVEAQRDGKCDFEFEVKWGSDLQTEHERWLCEVAFGGSPLFVTDYPKDIKAFYMRLNEDGKTVSAVDLLVPGVGELVGGSAREERIEILDRNMEGHGVADQLWWYRDLRKYGTVKHAGFGLGFERLVQLCTGLENIRDVTPFPRYPGHCEF